MSVKRQNNRGITLLEVVLSVAVMALVSAMALAVVNNAMQVTRMAGIQMQNDEEVSSLIAYLRQTFRRLPTGCHFNAIWETGEPPRQTLSFDNATGLFVWETASHEPANIITSLEASRNQEGLWDFIVRKNCPGEKGGGTPQGQKESLLKLAGGFKEIHWNFYDGISKQWTDSWSSVKGRPAAATLTLRRAGGAPPVRNLFLLSPIRLDTLPRFKNT
ncbi:MAG: prepilin-type N-terminal cleavage/methylation domain-containing protein [Verrucomicrobiae bacterium]|nr:prepilin-type N-terminal cleavage/methylation domain-containing protein [Verrucomicrobiae bacterium]